MKLSAIRNIATIITAVILIIAAIITLENYYAKSTVVEKIEERLDISIIDDQIFIQQHSVDQYRNLAIFERRSEETISPAVNEIIQMEEIKLEELKLKKVEKVKFYEQKTE